MRVQLKWSASRQMWIGQAVARPKSNKLVVGLMRWLQPVASTSTKRVVVDRVWQSARQRSW